MSEGEKPQCIVLEAVAITQYRVETDASPTASFARDGVTVLPSKFGCHRQHVRTEEPAYELCRPHRWP